VPAIPYAPSAAFIARERAKLSSDEGERPRIAIVVDGISAMHGVTRTIEEIRERGVDGLDIEVSGTDRNVDRRLAAVADVELPHYPGMTLGVPSLPAAVEAIADGHYDLIHVCSPGPSGVAAALLARAMELPLVGSYHTELAAYAGLRSGDPMLELTAQLVVGAFYSQCRLVLSPSAAADDALAELGIAAARIARWDRGVDTSRFDPALRDDRSLPGELPALAGGHRARRRLCERRRVLLSQRDRYVRAGRARSAGERPPGARRRRRWSARADHRRRERAPATGPRRGARRRAAGAGRLAGAAPAARARCPSQRRRADLGAGTRPPRRRLSRRIDGDTTPDARCRLSARSPSRCTTSSRRPSSGPRCCATGSTISVSAA